MYTRPPRAAHSTLLLYFGWDLLFATGRFQLLIYSSLMIALMLWLPNGVLSLMDRKGGRT